MSAILAIAKKDLRIAFTTSLAYVTFAVLTFLSGYFFLRLVVAFQVQSAQVASAQRPELLARFNLQDLVVAPMMLNTGFLLIFTVPPLTMRLLAAERSSGTYELLVASPVRPSQVVLGKYLAALAVTLAALALTAPFALLLDAFGQGGEAAVLDPGTVASGYLGLACLAAAYVAVGLLASALTTSQAVAAFGGFFLMLLLWAVGWVSGGGQDLGTRLLLYTSVLTHLDPFVRGIVRLEDLVYFGSVAALGLVLCHRWIEAERWR
jgi:ABC-2 type transport system permease protein